MLISRLESSEKFLKVAFRFSAAFGFLAVISGMVGGIHPFEVALVTLIMLGSLFYLSRTSMVLRVIALVVIGAVPFALIPIRSLPFAVNFLLSAGVLGGAFVGQFLGHWYLNVPNIHIREFKRISTLAFWFIGMRTVWVGITATFLRERGVSAFGFTAESEFFALKGNFLMGLGAFGLILFVCRILWGIVAPAILTGMARKTIALRATQSATGIFYANSVLVLLGEMTAIYLERELLWPV